MRIVNPKSFSWHGCPCSSCEIPADLFCFLKMLDYFGYSSFQCVLGTSKVRDTCNASTFQSARTDARFGADSLAVPSPYAP